MTRSRSLFNFGLQSSALRGDYEGVERALRAGADVNVLDASGRGAVMCAIAGEHWNDIEISSVMTPDRVKILEILLEDAKISLYAFNAPQRGFNGVTPLGMAAWLNSEIAVRLLLDSSSGVVDVDGMDSHGATPLMYAARDGNLAIVRILLQHGARPDFRDKNHRTSVQYALSHPHILHSCETLLRYHRQQENQWSSLTSKTDLSLPQAPSGEHRKTTPSLLEAVVSSDVDLVKNSLSPSSAMASTPILVNQPDSHGWSPIHHCSSARNLSREILDSLYCTGADVSLFTSKEHYTSLHCLAFSSSDDVYDFAIHLIRDLRAPLSAIDRQGATCIHFAAEHGSNVDLLKAFLECDTTGRVREMRDNNGMTPLDLAKPQFREVFGLATEDLRPYSSLSVSTIRPRLLSFPPLDCALQTKQEDDAHSLCDFDAVTAAHQLIDNLRITSPSLHHDCDSNHLNHIENLIRETIRLSTAIIRNLRSRSESASKAVKNVTAESSTASDLLRAVSVAANDKLVARGLGDLIRAGHGHRESEDSQLTAVSVTELKNEPSSAVVVEQVQQESEKGAQQQIDSVKDKTSSSSGASSFFKSWFRRKTIRETQGKDKEGYILSPADPIRSPIPSVRTEAPSEAQMWLAESADMTLRTSPVVLDAARRELSSIEEGLISASQFIVSSERSINRAERVIAKAIKKRKCMLADLRTYSKNPAKDLFIRPKNGSSHSLLDFNLSSKPSLTSLYSISSLNSEISTSDHHHHHQPPSSFEAIIAENDDEETKAIRRLILRKIEARTDGALDEVEKATPRLCVVKETVRGVKRRACLTIDVSRTN